MLFRSAVLLCLLFLLPATSASAAPTWLTPVTIGGPGTSDGGTGRVDASMNRDGAAVVAYTKHDPNTPDDGSDDLRIAVAAYRPPGGQFTPLKVFTAAPTHVSEIATAIDDAGNAVVLFITVGASGYQLLASSRGPAGDWSSPRLVVAKAVGDPIYELRVDENADGDLAVWYRGVVVGQGATGTVTGAITPLANQLTGSAITGTTAIDPAGNIVWTWERQSGPNVVVEVADKPEGAGVQPPETLTPNADNSEAQRPAVEIDDSGRALVAYGFNSDTVPNGIVRYHTRSSPQGNWASGTWTTNPSTASAPGQSANFYGIGVDTLPDGTAIITYGASDNAVWTAYRLVGQLFTGHQAVSDGSGSVFSQSLTVSADGTAVVAFYGSNAVQAAVREPGAVSFGPTKTDVDLLQPPGIGVGSAGVTPVAIDEDGNAVVAYIATQCPTSCTGYSETQKAVFMDGAPPELGTVTIPDTATVGAPVSFTAQASDQFSVPALAWTFGDGGTATGGNAGHTFTRPGDFTVEVTATDGVGAKTSRTGVVRVVAPPPANLDLDGDGSPTPQDCNDTNPGIRPGARDVPGNGVDEDCAGGDESVQLDTGLRNGWRAFENFTTVNELTLTKVAAGTRAVIRCKGKGCPFKTKTLRFKKNKSRHKLTQLFNRKRKGKRRLAKLRVGTQVSVHVLAGNAFGRFFVYKMRSGKVPNAKVGCLQVNSETTKAC